MSTDFRQFIIPISEVFSYPPSLHFPHLRIAKLISLTSNAKYNPSQRLRFSLYLIFYVDA